MMFSGWGRYPAVDCRELSARSENDIRLTLENNRKLIARGNGRSYGDSAINPDGTLSFSLFNRFISFDNVAGKLTCEAGVLLADVIKVFLPQGWFPPVTPGTKFVTIGGMVAADVHGKNHHKSGSFSRFIESMDLMLANGQVITCSQNNNSELFWATCGGMGLTGIILRVTFQLLSVPTSYIRQETLRARNLDEVMDLFEHSMAWTYSVAWIDCLASQNSRGRSLLYRGEHAQLDEIPSQYRAKCLAPTTRKTRKMLFDLPSFTINSFSVRTFNELYYGSANPGLAVIDYDRFFYPLDSVREWNRLYGKRGFFQYQCVLPKASSRAGLSLLLDKIAKEGQASFLAVLKLFGPQSGILSFPMEGYTLALDFPANAKTLKLMKELDAILMDHGGRLYLAKDARAEKDTMRFYSGLTKFQIIRSKVDPTDKFTSLQSRRLGL